MIAQNHSLSFGEGSLKKKENFLGPIQSASTGGGSDGATHKKNVRCR